MSYSNDFEKNPVLPGTIQKSFPEFPSININRIIDAPSILHNTPANRDELVLNLYFDATNPDSKSLKRKTNQLVLNSQFELARKMEFNSPFQEKTEEEKPSYYTGPVNFDQLCKDIKTAKAVEFPYDYKNYKSNEWEYAYRRRRQVNKPLMVRTEAGEDYTIKMTAKLNEKPGKICASPIYNTVNIDLEKKEIEYKKIIEYDSRSTGGARTYSAIEITCDNYIDFEILSQYLESYSNSNILNTFRNEIKKVTTPETLKFLLQNAPPIFLKEISVDTLWEYFNQLLEYDESSDDIDTSEAMLNILTNGFKNPRDVYEKLISNPELTMRIYKNMDNGKTMPFCQLATALVLLYTPVEDLEKMKKITFGDGYLLESTSPDGADKTKYVYLKNGSLLSLYRKMQGLEDAAEGQNADPLVIHTFSPLDLIELYDADNKSPKYMCAIAVKKFAKDKNNAEMWEFVMDVLTLISFFTSVGVLIRGASLLIRIAAITDIITTGVSQLIKLPFIKEWLGKSEAGRWFLSNWETINMIANLGVMSATLVKGIVKNGPKLIDSLRNSGKFLIGEGRRFLDRLEELYKNAKGLFTKVDDFEDELMELFMKTRKGMADGLGGRFFSIKEIKALRKYLEKHYGVTVKIIDKTPSLKSKLKDWNKRGVVGSFNPKEKTMYLRSSVSELTVFHETAHIRIWNKLSPEDYLKLKVWEDETYVWEQIWKTRNRWTKLEIIDSYDYVNRIRAKSGISKIVIEEIEELKKLNNLR